MIGFKTYDSSLIVHTEKVNRPADPRRRSWGPGFQSPDWETFNRLMKVLEARGFSVGRDPHIDKHYPTLGPQHRAGLVATPHGDLKFEAEASQTGCKIDFYQDVVTDHPRSGKYDFDRVAKMPYLIRKKFEGAIAACTEHLRTRGFIDTDRARTATPGRPIGDRLSVCDGARFDDSGEVSAAALAYFNSTWDGEYERKRGVHRFERGPDGWPTAREIGGYGRNHDRDKHEIRHGEIRYCRDLKGWLRRGRVFGGINGQWMVVYGPGQRDFTHASSFELFSYRPGVTPRKVHPRPQPLEAVLKAAVAREDYERAAKLRDLIRAHRAQAERAAA